MGVVIKGQHQGSLWHRNCSVSWLRWWRPEPPQVMKLDGTYHIHICTCARTHTTKCVRKLGRSETVSQVGCIDINILVVIFHYSSAKCYHWRSFPVNKEKCTTTYTTSVISKALILKSQLPVYALEEKEILFFSLMAGKELSTSLWQLEGQAQLSTRWNMMIGGHIKI